MSTEPHTTCEANEPSEHSTTGPNTEESRTAQDNLQRYFRVALEIMSEIDRHIPNSN